MSGNTGPSWGRHYHSRALQARAPRSLLLPLRAARSPNRCFVMSLSQSVFHSRVCVVPPLGTGVRESVGAELAAVGHGHWDTVLPKSAHRPHSFPLRVPEDWAGDSDNRELIPIDGHGLTGATRCGPGCSRGLWLLLEPRGSLGGRSAPWGVPEALRGLGPAGHPHLSLGHPVPPTPDPNHSVPSRLLLPDQVDEERLGKDAVAVGDGPAESASTSGLNRNGLSATGRGTQGHSRGRSSAAWWEGVRRPPTLAWSRTVLHSSPAQTQGLAKSFLGQGTGEPRWCWVRPQRRAAATPRPWVRHVSCCKTPARAASGASGGATQGTAAQPGVGLRRVTFLT